MTDFFLSFFFVPTDVVGEETIQIESRLFLMLIIYFPPCDRILSAFNEIQG